MKYIVLFIVVLLLLLKYPISQCYAIGSIREFLFPPKDLYVSIVERPIDVGREGSLDLGEVTFKYKGLYAVGIAYDKSLNDDDIHWKKRPLDLGIRISFYNNGKILYSKESTAEYNPYWGKNDNGVLMVYFNYPKDVKVKQVSCAVEVITVDQAFAKTFKSCRVFIRKQSEL